MEILYLNNNKIINIDAFGYSTFYNLKILRLNNNVISKIGRLKECSFLSQLKELYLYNNKLTNLDEFSGIDFSLFFNRFSIIIFSYIYFSFKNLVFNFKQFKYNVTYIIYLF